MKLEGFYGWIRNLIGYFLFLSILYNLLPGKRYARYIRLFSGMVLILLVLQPLTGGLRLEDQIARQYEAFVFRNQADDLRKEILGVETQRLEQIVAEYEHAVALDVRQMAVDMGWTVQECRAEIDEREGTEQFGTVKYIFLCLRERDVVAEPEPGENETLKENPEQPIQPVEPIRIHGQDGADAPETRPGATWAGAGRMAVLRRKIAAYYSLEEQYVEIQILEEER